MKELAGVGGYAHNRVNIQKQQVRQVPNVGADTTRGASSTVSLTPSSPATTVTTQSLTYSAPLAIKKPVLITFPESERILDVEKVKDYKIRDIDLDIAHTLTVIREIGDLDLAVEVFSEFFSRNFKDHQDTVVYAVYNLFEVYPKEKITNHAHLKQMLDFDPKKGFKVGYPCWYKTDDASIKKFGGNKFFNNRNLESQLQGKLQAYLTMRSFWIKNDKMESLEKLTRFSLKTMNFNLNLLEGKSQGTYEAFLAQAEMILTTLKPQHQITLIKGLQHPFIKSDIGIRDTVILLSLHKKDEEMIDLLAPIIKQHNFEDEKLHSLSWSVLGEIYRDNGKMEEAIKCFNKANEYEKDDLKLCVNTIKCLPKSNEKQEFFKALGEIKNQIKSILDVLKKYEKLFSEEQQYLEIKDRFTDNIVAISKDNEKEGIALVLEGGFEDMAKMILSRINPLTTANDLFLRKYQALLCPSVDAAIQSYEIADTEKVELFTSAGSAALVEENPAVAMSHAIEGLKLAPQNDELVEIGYIAALSLPNDKRAQEFIKAIPNDKKIEIIEPYITNVTAEQSNSTEESDEASKPQDIQSYLSEYDPSKNHRYHTIRKQQALTALMNPTSPLSQSEAGWKINGKEIKMLETTYIKKYRGLNCWGVIDSSIHNQIRGHLSEFEGALENGIITRGKGQNGVKILKGQKAFEIKIDRDKRAFTDEIHVNDKGQLLVIFDRAGTHEDVSKFAKKSKIYYTTQPGV